MQRVKDWLIGVSLFVLFLWSAAVAQGEDAGFTDLLNKARVARGLNPVACNEGIAVISAGNNLQQRAHGIGHWSTGGFGQCAATGVCNAEQSLSIWSDSPSHAAMLFSPNLICVGFACDGYCASVACLLGTTQPAPLTPSVVARPSVLLPDYGAGWRGHRGFRLFRRYR